MQGQEKIAVANNGAPIENRSNVTIAARSAKVVIVGGGVTGAALLWTLAKYTNIEDIVLLEKYNEAGMVNSHPLNNAQTSHDGSTETNYTLKHALEVKYAANLLRQYVQQQRNNYPDLYQITNRMVLGIGDVEVDELTQRFKIFKDHYPDLQMILRDEIGQIEPNIVKDRGPNEPIAALVSDQGYAIDYQMLAKSFIENSAKDFPTRVEVLFKTEVTSVDKYTTHFMVNTNQGKIKADVVIFAAGAYSLLYAQELGEAKHLAILPVAGSFFTTPNLLNGKVYRVQIPEMPFAAIHGDHDLTTSKETRFGPTTLFQPLMERGNYGSFSDFMKTPLLSSLKGLISFYRVLNRKQLFWYGVKNFIYQTPFLGRYFFLKEVKKIIPSIRFRDLKMRWGAGGIRPQIIDTTAEQPLVMGDSTIIGDKFIANTTPSPGASVCMANAVRDTKQVIEFFGNKYQFDTKKFFADFSIASRDKEKVETIAA